MWIIVGSASTQWSSGEYQSEGFSLEIVTPPVLPCLLQPELVQPWQPGQSRSHWDADKVGQALRWSRSPKRTEAHTAVAVPASTMLLTKCILASFSAGVWALAEGVRRGGCWIHSSLTLTPHANQMKPSSPSVLSLVRLIWPASWTSFYSPGPSRVGKASHEEREGGREIGFSPGVFMPVMRSITSSVAC